MSDSAAPRDKLPTRAGTWTFLVLGLLASGLPLALAACRKAHRDRPAPGVTQAAAPAPKAPPVAESAPPPRGKQLTIVYSSNLLGEYEPCG